MLPDFSVALNQQQQCNNQQQQQRNNQQQQQAAAAAFPHRLQAPTPNHMNVPRLMSNADAGGGGGGYHHQMLTTNNGVSNQAMGAVVKPTQNGNAMEPTGELFSYFCAVVALTPSVLCTVFACRL